MTEKEFLNLFNDIDDRFIEEERESTAPVYPVKIQYTAEKKSRLKSFSWGSFAAAAAVCAVAFGGIFAAVRYFGNGEFWVGNSTTVPYQTVTEYTSADLTAVPETEGLPVTEENLSDISGELPRYLQPVLYETTLNCNGKSYTLTARLYRIRGDESIDGVTIAELDKNYIWGDVSLELLLDGKLIDMLYICEYCYGVGQVGGMPFDRENLGSDYFKVLNMEQDVLAYLTPNAEIGAEDENGDAILNAMLFTVDKEDHLISIQRYATDEEKAELGTRPNGELTLYD